MRKTKLFNSKSLQSGSFSILKLKYFEIKKLITLSCDKPNMSMVLTTIFHESLELEPVGGLIPLDQLLWEFESGILALNLQCPVLNTQKSPDPDLVIFTNFTSFGEVIEKNWN